MKRLALVLAALVLFVVLAVLGCTNAGLVGPGPKADDTVVSSCVTCHTDKETLQAVADPEPEDTTSEETTGEG